MKASTLVGALVWVSFASAFTGIAPAASNDVQVTVESVSDSRSTGNSSPRCSVQLRFSGGDVSDAYNIHDVRVTTAVDDTGHDLRAEPNPERDRMRFSQGFYGPQGNNFAQQSMHAVELLSPPRESHSIKLLEGEAELLFPTTENGGLVIIKNFLAHPGQTLTNPALKKLNVNITYFGKDGDEANTSTQRVQSTPSTPLDPTQTPRRLPFRRLNQMPGLQFSVDDPDHRLVDMTFMDAYCRQTWGGMNSMGPNTRVYQLQGEVPSTLRLYIYLAAPEAIKTVPFKIENIELP
jgi:hypothetical protein